MLGALTILVVLLVVLPVGILMLSAAISALTSWSMTSDAEARHEGSELLDIS